MHGRIDRVRYARDPRLIWRVAADRVLTRRVGDHSEQSTSEVTGPAAVLFLALDRPLTVDELATELALAGSPQADELVGPTIDVLVTHGLAAEQPG
jgi:hypothetical protein